MATYSQSLILAWNLAALEAQAGNSPEIEPAHLLLGVCKLCDLDLPGLFAQNPGLDINAQKAIEAEVMSLRQAFLLASFDHTGFRRRLRGLVALPGERPVYADGQLHRSADARLVFQRAESLSLENSTGEDVLTSVNLLQALLEIPEAPWVGLLVEMGKPDLARAIFASGEEAARQPISKTPFLDRFGRDLTRLAHEGKLEPIIGRREEMRTLARVLSQKRKSNAILVGEAGVGKTGVVEGFAQRIIEPNAPVSLRNKRIIEVSMASLVAGTKHRGEFEERMQALINEVSHDQEVILFIDEIHTILGAGGEGASDAANILKPALARGDLHLIGATTIAEFRKYIEKDSALERRFQVIWVEEPSRAEAVEILKGLRHKFEEHHVAEISDVAIEAAVELSMRYLPDLRLPDKAIDLIDQACSTALIRSLSVGQDHSLKPTIGPSEIAAVVAQRCRIPVERLTEDETQRLLQMERELGKRVIGQAEAVRAVAEAVRAARAGLKDPRRPVGVFLFVGATGTGKTELAKALAEFLFDDERQLIRIDMSEYKDKHNLSRLIGAPPGYIGYDEEGQLTGPVRTHPFSVVLFDEVEKAHPEVLDIFLQIFDDGVLTDSHGRHVSFADTVIILTSNLGSQAEAPRQPLGFIPKGREEEATDAATQAYRQQIMAALHSSFRPELFNRIQQIVFFYPLGEAAIRQIIDKFLGNLRKRLSERNMDLSLTDAAYALLMQEGFDPRYGAREMERVVEQRIVQPLANALLEGRFSQGADIFVDTRDRKLVFDDVGRTQPYNPS